MANAAHSVFCCVALGALLLAGCGASTYELAPVSGRVTLDEKALAGARVSFEPQAEQGKDIVGPGSFAVTDDDGRYVLATVDKQAGAVIGKHRVTIGASLYSPDRTKMEVIREEEVPAKYNADSQLTFDVPTDGSDAADFELWSE